MYAKTENETEDYKSIYKRNNHKSSKLYMIYYLLIMVDTLLLRGRVSQSV